MTARSKLIIGTAVAALALSAHTLYACAGCGCADKATPKPHAHGEKDTCPSGVCSLSAAPKAPAEEKSYYINTFQLKQIVDSGSAILLDARSGKYDDGYRIPGAKSLSAKSTPEEIAAVLPSKDAAVVTYCSNTQCPASKMLFKHLQSLGYTNLKEYPEGIAGWRAAGGRVEKAQ